MKKTTNKKTKGRARKADKLQNKTSRRVSKLLSSVDQKLMSMAADRYEKVFQTLNKQGRNLNEDRQLAIALGQNILRKIKSVQNSFSSAASSKSPIDISLLNIIKKSKKTRKSDKKENA